MRFYHWLGVSLLLHSTLTVPFIVSALPAPERANRNKLAIELYGMIADRQQVEKRRAGVAIPKPAPRVVRQQTQVKKPEQPPPVAPQPVVAEWPAEEQSADKTASGADQATAVFVPVPGPSGSGGTADADQRAQSLGSGRQGADRMSIYTATVARRLQANLVYPEEMRKKGVEAVAIIAFTITASGDIKGGIVRIKKSSGYAALDASAVKSARVSAPFQKPPREITLGIAVSFEVESGRGRGAMKKRANL